MEEEVSLAQVGLVGLDENRLHAEAAKGEAPQYARLHSLDVDREQIDARASTQQARQHLPGVHAPGEEEDGRPDPGVRGEHQGAREEA